MAMGVTKAFPTEDPMWLEHGGGRAAEDETRTPWRPK